jgi:hypothetical protein
MRTLGLFAAAVAGAIAGTVGSLWFAHGLAPQPSVDRVNPLRLESGRPSEQAPRVVRTIETLNDAELRARVERLEQERELDKAKASAPTEAAVDSLPTPEEDKRALEDRLRTLKQRFEADPRDPQWSVSSVAAFRSDFAALEQQAPLKLVNVDCRTTACIATVRWPNYETALQQGDALVHHPYSVNCSRHLTMPPPDDPAASYESTVQFDCTEDREVGPVHRDKPPAPVRVGRQLG